jgi:hypothetical protein
MDACVFLYLSDAHRVIFSDFVDFGPVTSILCFLKMKAVPARKSENLTFLHSSAWLARVLVDATSCGIQAAPE